MPFSLRTTLRGEKTSCRGTLVPVASGMIISNGLVAKRGPFDSGRVTRIMVQRLDHRGWF